MMTGTLKILNPLLVTLLLIGTPTISAQYVGGMLKGRGGGSSGVAEILAAGLITSLLMDNKPKSMPIIRHAMSHHFIGGYSPMHHHVRHPMHPMHPLLAARIPMMNPYVFQMMPQQQYNLINHALISQVSKHQAFESRLNDEIQALQEQESILEAALARARQGSETALNELLNEEEETIPAAALLLETTEFMTPAAGLRVPHPLPPPEMFQTTASETESRYILPRIVRHFVQRLLRRGEHH